jgi:phenylalanyl-tRNA synthetase alpha chain
MPDLTLEDSVRQVEAARDEALALVAAGKVDEAQAKFLSRKGRFKDLQSLLGKLPAEARPAFGKVFHEAKQAVEEAANGAGGAAAPKRRGGPMFDFLPAPPAPGGAVHPLIQTMREITDIFARMGFDLAEGPEIEDPFHNFDALNIPEDHPARDPGDNFYIRPDLLVRSQTSTVQIRVMERTKPPIRVIAMGRVYRPDEWDATHSPMFHQVEGLVVDRGINLAHLKTTLRGFCRAYLGEDVQIRFRPSFFPFTEPSIEVDMSFGRNNDRWVELGGAGMVDPNVFKAVGYDPEEVSGFAFGLGIERMAMRRYGVEDIRSFFAGDVRFLRQFA